MIRQAPRRLRFYTVLAAFVAVAATIVLPAVHGVHAPHFAAAAAIEVGALPVVAPPAERDTLGCPLCLGVGQARTAVTAQPTALRPLAATTDRAPLSRIEAPPLLAARAPASPRAPPV